MQEIKLEHSTTVINSIVDVLKKMNREKGFKFTFAKANHGNKGELVIGAPRVEDFYNLGLETSDIMKKALQEA
jgi:uncharacterized protein YwlG (UPF0340 family)